MDFRAASALTWREAVLTGEVTAVELTQRALSAEAASRHLGAFIHIDAEAALASAEQQDATVAKLRQVQGTSSAAAELSARAPLLGLPTAFKDLVPVAGMPLTMGTRAIEPMCPVQDAPLARRVHHAGAISIGKTQVPELGLHCYSENQVAAPARNPLQPELTAGGSTGGGAAAVAAGILPLAPGNDGGGSVRIPAAATGLVGLKPGRKRMPDDDQTASIGNVATSGPLATSVADAALLFDVMAGNTFSGAQASGTPTLASGPALRAVEQARRQGLERLRVGVSTDSPFSPDLDVHLDEGAVTALEAGVELLKQAGHQVTGTRDVTGAQSIWPGPYFEDFTVLWTSRFAHAGFSEAQKQLLEPIAQHYLGLAEARSTEREAAAVQSLEQFRSSATELFDHWDLLLTPMLATAPPEVGWFSNADPETNYQRQCLFTPYSSVVNVLGLPAINVPVHTDREGLSWSVQLLGSKGTEELLLSVAAVMERDMAG